MKDLEKIEYELGIAGGGLKGLGILLAGHFYDEEERQTDITGANLGHAVEALGILVGRLAADLEAAAVEQRRTSGEHLHLRAGGAKQ